MSLRIRTLAAVPVLAAGLAVAPAAFAHGWGGFSVLPPAEIAAHQATRFDEVAAMLGLTIDTVKAGWAEGKTIRELATANGISDDQLSVRLRAARTAQLHAVLQAMVSAGTITHAQADQRMKFIESKNANHPAEMGRHHGRGMRW